MTGWLLYKKSDSIRNKGYIDMHVAAGNRIGIKILLIFVEDISFGIDKNTWFLSYQGKKIRTPDFAIMRMNYPLLTKQLELIGITVFNNSMVAEICNDKARTYQYVAQADIPMVPTRFVRNEFMSEQVKQIALPTIIKSVSGHGGSQVFLFQSENSEKEKQEYVEKLLSDHVVFQPFVEGKNQDLRVYVIGKEIIAAVLRTAKEGFKSNFSLGGQVDSYSLSKSEIETVKKIIALFEFHFVGIDFILGEDGELIFNEIEDVVGSRMLYQCTDIDVVSLYLEYIWNYLH
ncbi:ATP-grasp domain-containing protein [Anaeromicropila populeti]|uniref:Gamma-F420-2:alpha-L-glutamate ligase n=1 Tax=Anaeromicropila populeti TaxID=37658 RepID=A0A1I6KHY7_9FIRM|nr:ATP-grasp domain-containing protein [Anaeromicropila populeti]SFR90668.1 gamma-F420-2:alpha-L-glutamate ligase [Anaeromicropila populeti]